MTAVRVRVRMGSDPSGGILAIVGWSALAHLTAIIILIFAPRVLPRKPPPPLVLSGQIVSLPPSGAAVRQPPAAPAAPPAAQTSSPKPPAPPAEPKRKESPPVPPEPGKPKAEKPPVPIRKEVPSETPGKAEEEPVKPAPPPAASPIAEGVGLASPAAGDPGGVPSISSSAFPYDWYRTTMVNLIRARWRRPVTPGLTTPLRCSVSFVIARNGAVTDVALAAASGFAPLDLSASRAVMEAGPLPQLPYQYTQPEIRAELVFELTPD